MSKIDEKALETTLDIAKKANTVTTLSYEEVIRIYCDEAANGGQGGDMPSDLEWALQCIDGNLSPDTGQTIRKYLSYTKQESNTPKPEPQTSREDELMGVIELYENALKFYASGLHYTAFSSSPDFKMEYLINDRGEIAEKALTNAANRRG